MPTKIHDRQVEHRTSLPQLSQEAKPTLRQVLPSVDSDLTPPFSLRESSTPDLILNVGVGSITSPGTSINRQFAPINKQVFSFGGGTITFPGTSGGTITVSPGTNGTLTVASGNYIKVLVQVDETGQMSVKTGVQSVTPNGATLPEHDDDVLPVGYVIMQNIGGVIQNVENANIIQFVSPVVRPTIPSSIPLFLGIVVGNATDVANGDAHYSTIASAIAAATAGDRISLLPRNFNENLVINKEIQLFGAGRSSTISGTVNIQGSASYSTFRDYYQNGNITIDNGAVGIIIVNSQISSTTTITDNNPTSDNSLYLVVQDL